MIRAWHDARPTRTVLLAQIQTAIRDVTRDVTAGRWIHEQCAPTSPPHKQDGKGRTGRRKASHRALTVTPVNNGHSKLA